MRNAGRLIIVVCCLAIMAEAFVLWDATGRAGFTRYHDPDRAQREESTGVADLFADTGLEASTGKLETAPNDFAFGLAPGGIADRNLLSVTTLSLPALLILVVSLAGWFRAPRRATAPATPENRA